jgi:hypothetical protein
VKETGNLWSAEKIQGRVSVHVVICGDAFRYVGALGVGSRCAPDPWSSSDPNFPALPAVCVSVTLTNRLADVALRCLLLLDRGHVVVCPCVTRTGGRLLAVTHLGQ